MVQHRLCCLQIYFFDFGYNVDLDQMKEKFTKLLLGEDMSGGGKGVSSALALSNAITNLAGTWILIISVYRGYNIVQSFQQY